MTGRPIASRFARRSKPFSVAGAALFFAGAVRAEPDDTALLRAQALFDEARALMKEGRYPEACPKLAESQRLDPGGGTLLNLGICHARAGLTASAHTELRAALAQAETDNRADRVKTAQHQLDELSPKLSWLRVHAASDITTLGVRVEIDGVELSHADFGNELPIDPGVHEVKATAPGHLPWSTRVQIAPALDHQSVDVPALEPEPRPLLVEVLFLGVGALPREAQLDDIAGHDPHQEEDDHRDTEKGRDHQEQALDDVLDHVAAPTIRSATHRRAGC